MFESDKPEFSSILKTTLKIYRIEPDTPVILLWWSSLNRFSLDQVRQGFGVFVGSKSSKYPPVPAHIIDAIELCNPDGRPGADEAWAMIPRDEAKTVVWTQEMSQALGIAQALLNEGDQVAARRAFIDAYTRIVEQNKLVGVPVQWFPSLGSDTESRESVLREAIRLGRIGADQAAVSVPEIENTKSQNPAIEDKCCISRDQLSINIGRLRSVIGASRIGVAA